MANKQTPETDLPSFVRPELVAVMADIAKVREAWNPMGINTRAKYLPQEMFEPDREWRARLMRTTYIQWPEFIAAGFCGTLAKYTLEPDQLPLTLQEVWDKDVDGKGNDLKTFMQRADELALRDGGCWIQVDKPSADIQTEAQRRALGIRPYLILHERDAVLNWRTTENGSQEVLEQLTLARIEMVPDGRFGVKQQKSFRVFQIGQWQDYIVQSDGKNKEQIVEGGSGLYGLSEIPFIWYSGNKDRAMGAGHLPMLQIAELSIEHWRDRSDRKELIHKTCIPVPVRTGMLPNPDGQPQPLYLGQYTVVDVPQGGTFGYAEPSGSSLAISGEQIRHTEELIDRQALSFMNGASGAMTATEALQRGDQTEASLLTLANSKINLFSSIVRLWCLMTNETSEAQISFAEDLLAPPMDAPKAAFVKGLFDSGLLDEESTLRELQAGKAISSRVDVQEQAQRAEAQRQAMIRAQLAAVSPAAMAEQPTA